MASFTAAAPAFQPPSSFSALAPAASALENAGADDSSVDNETFFVIHTEIGQSACLMSFRGRAALREHLESFLEEHKKNTLHKTAVKALSLEELAKRVFEISEEDYDHDESTISAIIAGGKQFPQPDYFTSNGGRITKPQTAKLSHKWLL